MRVGLVSPGAMGSAIAARLIENGAEVIAALSGRSPRTHQLAEEAGIRPAASLEDLVVDSDVVLSIVVPSNAFAVASEIAVAISVTKARPLVIDCNAVSPGTVAAAGDLVTAAGGRFVDASIIGPPPRTDENTVLFVSGPHARECESLREYGLRVRTVGDSVGSASALKMSYAALTKGLVVLGVQLLIAARANGVYDDLQEIMNENVPELGRFFAKRVPELPVKAFRFVGEMEEIDATLREAGLPGGTFGSMARVCEWLAATPLAEETPETRDRSRSVHDTVEFLSNLLEADGD